MLQAGAGVFLYVVSLVPLISDCWVGQFVQSSNSASL